ncbi:hypothetical protein, partial [Neolewinella aurantiaca]|uniref:hypothetical protein n=1 Tax=Neolewinella aurantiaca TaxID=2602767 RepID=UPI00164F0400
NGFGLEAINFKPVGRSNLFMAIVGLSYSLTVRVGWAARSKIRIIHYADGAVFPTESVFRKGLSLLMPWCASMELFLKRYLSLDDGRNHPIFKNVE